MSRRGEGQPRTIFICQECGKESLKWLGRCPNCQEWNTFVEKTLTATASRPVSADNLPRELSQVSIQEQGRFTLPISEFNRVLGDGLVRGSLVLVAGDPGIGKSTLLLQAAALMAGDEVKVVYVSAEETVGQIKLRAQRLGIKGEGLYLLAETDLEAILNELDALKPNLVVVDSIQAVYSAELEMGAGSVTQVRECTLRLMHWAKRNLVPVLITGHVTKEGAIAGPRVLEHIVDVVLYFEGEAFSSYRLLHSAKNRFGSTDEVGIFEMKSQGLVEVDNPSQVFLSQREGEAVGSVVVPTIEGTRPILVEIQALTNPTGFGLPRRTANGIDFNRLLLIIAVLTRRLGLKLGNQDIIVNVTGGLRIREPAADLGIALAIASSFRDMVVSPGLLAVGEIGLSGELRGVSQLDRRLTEAGRLGFTSCLVPRLSAKAYQGGKALKLIPVGSLREAILEGLKPGRKKELEK